MTKGGGMSEIIPITSNLIQRIWQHREGVFSGFSQRYDAKSLVWFEPHSTMESAIMREKRIIPRINDFNPYPSTLSLSKGRLFLCNHRKRKNNPSTSSGLTVLWMSHYQ
jgi:hypothetical protein